MSASTAAIMGPSGPRRASFGLPTLLAPHSPQEFMRSCWPTGFWFNPGRLDRFEALREIDALRSVDTILAAFEGRGDLLQTWFPEGDIRHTHWGRHHEARRHYDGGARLQLNQAENCVPELYALMGALELDLGLPLHTVSTTVIASPPGARAEPHMDSYPQFTVQLGGRKRWRVGAQICPYSLHSFVLGEDDTPMHRFYGQALPARMAPDARELEVSPGDVLFMPSGQLHAVESVDHALSIAFDLVIPRWSELVTRWLSDELNRSLMWRSFALGLGSTAPGPRRRDAQATIARLLSGLPRHLAGMLEDPAQVLEAVGAGILPPASRWLERDPKVVLELCPPTRAARGEGWVLRGEHPREGRFEIELTTSLVRLCRWILARSDRFLDVEAYYASAGALEANVRQLLATLLDTGALRGIPREGADG